jgi:AcrR family transcriptional regulator
MDVDTASPPPDAPLPRLPDTARELLTAARKIVLRDGLHSLTLQAVQDATGHNKAMVNHCFGSKAGLVAAVFDSLAHENEVLLRRQVEALSDSGNRVQTLIYLQREASGDRRAMTAYFETLPHMLRERQLRWRLAALCEGFRQLDEWALASGGDSQSARLADLAAVTLAVTQGLGVQAAVDPERFATDGPYEVWEEMVRLYLAAHGRRRRRFRRTEQRADEPGTTIGDDRGGSLADR